jgi:Cu2+-containing amine oxidase
MKRRGLSDADIELVQVDPFSAGYFDREVEKGRRLVSAVSYWRKDIKDNGYAHPIEGVVALVDLIENRIVHLVDEPDIIPIPRKSRNYDRASIPQTRSDVKPLDIVQKDGRALRSRAGRSPGRTGRSASAGPRAKASCCTRYRFATWAASGRSSIAPASPT